MKEGSMPDEQLKTVFENSASAVMRITVHYLHFALIPMETEFFDNFWHRQHLNHSGVNF